MSHLAPVTDLDMILNDIINELILAEILLCTLHEHHGKLYKKVDNTNPLKPGLKPDCDHKLTHTTWWLYLHSPSFLGKGTAKGSYGLPIKLLLPTTQRMFHTVLLLLSTK